MRKVVIGKIRWIIPCVVALLLVLIQSPVVMAAGPQDFEADGTITYISTGVVKELGNSGRWRVIDREIEGVLSGDINGTFNMNYRANVELETQAGNLQGMLYAGTNTFRLEGKSLPIEMVWFDAFQTYLPKVTMKGHWVSAEIAGHGTFEGWGIFIPTPDGHVGTIVASSFLLRGKWQPQ